MFLKDVNKYLPAQSKVISLSESSWSSETTWQTGNLNIQLHLAATKQNYWHLFRNNIEKSYLCFGDFSPVSVIDVKNVDGGGGHLLHLGPVPLVVSKLGSTQVILPGLVGTGQLKKFWQSDVSKKSDDSSLLARGGRKGCTSSQKKKIVRNYKILNMNYIIYFRRKQK